ncbi:TadE/TadG family type IV pilus assembly protein [Bradyrhizobium sp. Ce-3]|uniref:TadE/TadG family type IV pilus assembly protein n=1 Tax=Bradyrhizobium sp. Ce-3 TaxID=2913970 RepID=UPI001FBA2554|nr:hypothetical protein [Bradyrhizobium sp. Ce-3]GKQ49719.1 hypothetical protein BRSPCE3_05730 [Bradyrhizobium sp. Ce-3]
MRDLLADRRGVAALEFVLIAGFLFFALLIPIGDVAVGALRFMQVKQGMRDLGAFVQYNPPPDLTNAATWPALPSTVGTFTVKIGTAFPTVENQINVTVSCGTPPTVGAAAGAACTTANMSDPSTPKYVWMGAVVKLKPFVIKSLTGGNIGYAERLQWPPQ